MMKKTYNKPTLNIVLLKSSTHLLNHLFKFRKFLTCQF